MHKWIAIPGAGKSFYKHPIKKTARSTTRKTFPKMHLVPSDKRNQWQLQPVNHQMMNGNMFASYALQSDDRCTPGATKRTLCKCLTSPKMMEMNAMNDWKETYKLAWTAQCASLNVKPPFKYGGTRFPLPRNVTITVILGLSSMQGTVKHRNKQENMRHIKKACPSLLTRHAQDKKSQKFEQEHLWCIGTKKNGRWSFTTCYPDVAVSWHMTCVPRQSVCRKWWKGQRGKAQMQKQTKGVTANSKKQQLICLYKNKKKMDEMATTENMARRKKGNMHFSRWLRDGKGPGT